VFIHVHGADFQKFYHQESGFIKQGLIRYILNKATRLIVLSAHWQSWFAKIVNADKIRVLANPVDDYLPPSQYSQRPLQIILFMGSLEARKGVVELLDAFIQLHTQYPELRLVYGGSGVLQTVLQEKISSANLEDFVQLAGWVSGEAKSTLLQQADLFILPSFSENFPVALLEAMSAALPVITTAVGGIVDIVEHEQNGLLVKPGDTDAIIMQVQRLLDQPELAQSLGQRARQYVQKHCTTEKVMAELHAIYGEVL